MQISVEITNVIVDPEFNAAEIIITPIFSSGDAPVVDVPIETISANGVNIPIVNKNIDIIIPTKTSDLTKDDVYTKTEINNKLSAVYEFKGSVLTYAELPTNAENADVYNVEETGVNYAWVQATESWDSLGGLIGLATLTENGLLSKEDFAKLQNLSGTNTGDETQDSLGEKIEITELTEITDTTKIAASDSAFLKWFSGLRIKNYLTGFFAKLSGGNTFAGDQRIIDRIIFGASGISNRFGTDGTGLYCVADKSFRIISHFRVRPGDSYDAFDIDTNGNSRFLIGKYQHNSASITSDTINDTRTVNTSGLWELFKCSLGNVTKGLGTWIYGRLKLGMVIETEINEYADNAAALAAGLTAGMKYRTGDLYKIVH